MRKIYFIFLILSIIKPVFAQNAENFKNSTFLKMLYNDPSYTKLKERIVVEYVHANPGHWGEPMKGAARSIYRLAKKYPELNFILPLHKNPIVRDAIIPILKHTPNIRLIEPLDYWNPHSLYSFSN